MRSPYAGDYPIRVVSASGTFTELASSAPPGVGPQRFIQMTLYIDGYNGTVIGRARVRDAYRRRTRCPGDEASGRVRDGGGSANGDRTVAGIVRHFLEGRIIAGRHLRRGGGEAPRVIRRDGVHPSGLLRLSVSARYLSFDVTDPVACKRALSRSAYACACADCPHAATLDRLR